MSARTLPRSASHRGFAGVVAFLRQVHRPDVAVPDDVLVVLQPQMPGKLHVGVRLRSGHTRQLYVVMNHDAIVQNRDACRFFHHRAFAAGRPSPDRAVSDGWPAPDPTLSRWEISHRHVIRLTLPVKKKPQTSAFRDSGSGRRGASSSSMYFLIHLIRENCRRPATFSG